MELPNQVFLGPLCLCGGGAVGQVVAVMASMGPEQSGVLLRSSLCTPSE
jgi:hypothetical protein